jgi:hypothetical protein
MAFSCSSGTTTTRIIVTNALPTNQWVHFAVVNDGQGTGRIYWNAQLVAQGYMVAPDALTRSNLFFACGAQHSSGFFAGLMYGLSIWGDARTADEIYADLYLASGSARDNLLAWFRAAEGQGATLGDSSGNGNTARMNGANWNTTEAMPTPFWGIGQASGEYSETMTGLRRVPILLKGTFTLQRINRNSELN